MARWVKGQSGNPAGRKSVGKTLTEALRAELDRRGPDGRTHRDAITAKLLEIAQTGNIEAMKLIFERADGRVPMALDVTTAGAPLAPFAITLIEVADNPLALPEVDPLPDFTPIDAEARVLDAD